MAPMGAIMLIIRRGIPGSGFVAVTSLEIMGCAPSRNTFPSFLTRASALRIGPMSQLVIMTVSAKNRARIA